jgi:hypothetical protein
VAYLFVTTFSSPLARIYLIVNSVPYYQVGTLGYDLAHVRLPPNSVGVSAALPRGDGLCSASGADPVESLTYRDFYEGVQTTNPAESDEPVLTGLA